MVPILRVAHRRRAQPVGGDLRLESDRGGISRIERREQFPTIRRRGGRSRRRRAGRGERQRNSVGRSQGNGGERETQGNGARCEAQGTCAGGREGRGAPRSRGANRREHGGEPRGADGNDRPHDPNESTRGESPRPQSAPRAARAAEAHLYTPDLVGAHARPRRAPRAERRLRGNRRRAAQADPGRGQSWVGGRPAAPRRRADAGGPQCQECQSSHVHRVHRGDRRRDRPRARRKVGTGRFPGDDDHPHQSGNSRNCGIGAAPPEGAGGDPRDRRHRVRRRVGLDVGGDEGGLRGLEGDHDHEHVRPPRDPGGRVGRIFGIGPRAARGRTPILRFDLRDPARSAPPIPDLARPKVAFRRDRSHEERARAVGARGAARPGVSQLWASPLGPRSARDGARAVPAPRARPRALRLHDLGPRPRVLRLRYRWEADGVAPRDPRHAPGFLRRNRGNRGDAPPRLDPARLAPRASRGRDERGAAGGRGNLASPAEAHRGRRLRALPPHAICGKEALQLGRGRGAHSAPRSHLRARGGGGGRGGGDRDGAPRAAQRARQFSWDAARADFRRVRGQPERRRPGAGRCQVSLGFRGDPPIPTKRPRARGHGGRQPEPPRGGESGRRGDGAREAGRARRHGTQESPPRAHPRRRGLRRPRDRPRNVGNVGARRIHDRRHDPRRRQ